MKKVTGWVEWYKKTYGEMPRTKLESGIQQAIYNSFENIFVWEKFPVEIRVGGRLAVPPNTRLTKRVLRHLASHFTADVRWPLQIEVSPIGNKLRSLAKETYEAIKIAQGGVDEEFSN
jgi:hypothetical protein